MELVTQRSAVRAIDEQYRSALLEYVTSRKEAALVDGYELGRRALSEGLGVLEMIGIHSRAVAAIIAGQHSAHEREQMLDAQTSFAIEALSPFEMAHRAFQDANAMLRKLNDVLEGQAKRIASELHNEAGQLLATVHVALADAARDLPEEKTIHIAMVRNLLVEIEDRLRNLSYDLRPSVLEDLGLCAALELLADGVSKRWGLPVTVNASIEDYIPASIENTVYRIAQEALTNAAKHAQASQAEIELRQARRTLVCSVRDNGVGIDDTAALRKRRGLGLTEIRERVAALGGVVRLGLNNERGTDLTIEIPMGG